MSEVIHPPDEAQMIARAVRAYGQYDAVIRAATIRRFAGREYVHIPRSDGRGPVVYRIHNNGALRQMIAPPPEILDSES